MEKLNEVTADQCRHICQLVGLELREHTCPVESGNQHLLIRVVAYIGNSAVKYISIHPNGLVQHYIFNPTLILQLKHLPINAMLITDYLRSIGYKFSPSTANLKL